MCAYFLTPLTSELESHAMCLVARPTAQMPAPCKHIRKAGKGSFLASRQVQILIRDYDRNKDMLGSVLFIPITFESTNLWCHQDSADFWALMRQKKEKLPHLPWHFSFFSMGRRLEPSGLLVLEALSLAWTPSSGKFRFPFKWQLPAFLANGNDIISHMLTVCIGLRDTAGSTPPVRSGITPRMCNRYSLRHCKLCQQEQLWYLPNSPCHIQGWTSGLPGCSDQGPGGVDLGEKTTFGVEKG